MGGPYVSFLIHPIAIKDLFYQMASITTPLAIYKFEKIRMKVKKYDNCKKYCETDDKYINIYI